MVVRSIAIGPCNSAETRELEVKGVFIFKGLTLRVDTFKYVLELDAEGYIKTGPDLTSLFPAAYRRVLHF